MLRIERSGLLDTIWQSSENGSIILTGSPGSGKTWAIAQLVRHCRSTGRPHLVLAADDFDVHSISELTAALNLETDLISLIRSLGPGAVVIIDGLDALRSDASQGTFRGLIQSISMGVPACSVVASIRSFDLQQSVELQRLFFAPDRPAAKPFVEICVGHLSEAELVQVAYQVPELSPLLQNLHSEFYQLIRNPFNLQLAYLLLQRGLDWHQLSTTQTQAQLLEMYWSARIDQRTWSQGARVTLRNLLREMIAADTLSVPQQAVDNAGASVMVDLLRSEEIVRISATGRLSFAHNILFDFAVARLLLDETSLNTFLQEDPSRSIFYRPSLSFFFQRLWISDRDLFWRVIRDVYLSEDNPQRVRILAGAAIYEAARDEVDVAPVFDWPTALRDEVLTSLLRALQAFNALDTSTRRIWVELLVRVSENPSLQFINEMAALLGVAAESTDQKEQADIAQAARKVLAWVWKKSTEMSVEPASELCDFAAARILPIALRSYSSDILLSRNIVSELLARMGTPRSGPHEAFRLANEIRHIVRADPATGVRVYAAFFAHEESSESMSAIGGPVFRMTSTRKQDFSIALYSLHNAFNDYLGCAPMFAAEAAIKSVTAELSRERPDARPNKSVNVTFLGQQGMYIPDRSELWDTGTREHTSLQMLDLAFKYAGDLLSANKTEPLALEMLRVIFQDSVYGAVWRRLLKEVRRNPKSFVSIADELFTNLLILGAPETTREAGEALKALYLDTDVPEKTALLIEQAISQIPTSGIDNRYEKSISIRNRLVRCIPETLLRSTQLRELSQTLSREEDSTTAGHFETKFGFMSDADALRLHGIDVDNSENAELLKALEPIEAFSRKYLNETPPLAACDALIGNLKKIQQVAKDFSGSEELSDRARGALCSAAETIAKTPEVERGGPLWLLCRAILLGGAHDPVPRFNPKYHLVFEDPSWGSPSPRIEAAQGLGHFVFNWGVDAEIASALKALSIDKVPAVRFQVPNATLGFYKHGAKDEFWTIITGMVEEETTAGVMLGVVHVLGRIVGSEPERVSTLVSRIVERGFALTKQHELLNHIVGLLLWLCIFRNDEQAGRQLRAFEEDAAFYHRAINEMVIGLLSYFRLQTATERSAFIKARAFMERVLLSIYRARTKILNGEITEQGSENLRHLLMAIDQVALQVSQLLQSAGAGSEDNLSYARDLYREVAPVLRLLVLGAEQDSGYHLAAPTAHHLMEAFNSVLDVDPAGVLQYAAAVCRAATRAGYHFDQMAMTETTKLAERILADHKDTLRNRETAAALGDLLDNFVKAGWPDAVRLVFKLDEAIK